MNQADWRPERPCPIPGHPQDGAPDDEPRLVTETAWQRLQAWHLHAPAERLPLPAILLTWPACWLLHAAGVPSSVPACGTAGAVVLAWTAWHRHRKKSPHPRLAPFEAAAVAAACGGWVTAAVTWGPLGWPYRLLTCIYVTGAAAGYWWLHAHEAVRAARKRRDDAAAERADRRAWHQILPRVGLDGWHVQWARDTNLGEERLITTSPENALATRIAANSAAIAEKLAHILGLPYGRIDFTTTDYPGELIIGIRTVDLSVRDAAYHPMTAPWPDPQPSPFADWFPGTDTIRTPVTWGFCPEDGSALAMELFSDIGGRTVGVIGMTGSGKSNLLNGAREKVTRCPDARLVQLNGAHMGDELTWEPLSALTLCGPVATDEALRANIAKALAGLCLLVTNRSATLAETGHSTFQPTPQHPAVTVVIDEVDEIVKHVPGAGQALEFLASKQRKSAVCLLLATQRAIVAALGGGAVRANMSEVLVGKVARATESRHATGAEKEIPDIREYAKGAPGYFQRWDPHSGQISGRGRALLLGKPPEELAYMKRLVQARRHLRDWSIPDMPPLTLDGPGEQATAEPGGDATRQQIGALRGRLASITQTDNQPAARPPATAVQPYPLPLEIPQANGQALLRLLARPDGVNAKEAGQVVGKSKSRAGDYLRILASQGIAVRTGSSRASRYRLASLHRPPAVHAPERPDGYVTIETLADAVHDGLVDVDDETRAVLEQARQIRGQAARPPHLHVVPDPESDAS
jgi:hypothetical protein